ncbi:hypothetical protein G0U57_021411, partial [Chelydra serpentina]
MDLFGHKVYSSSTLQVRMADYATLLAKYAHRNYGKFMEFINDISEEKQQQLKAVVSEGQMISHTALQATLDVADTATRSTATTVVMHRALWLSSS